MSEAKTKSILGYQLKELLGTGGYGEVWSAEAPGGLLKAVKLVYGYHDDHRAQTELKALERIKQIRHPFLLSLERIDIVDGQLVIVSELADGCLADIHRQYVQEGNLGIPRDVLIPLIRDAAEALDYLATKHSLQHLDVKPDNLLVVGDHVKLADFGLVKDINKTNQSLVTGLTPIYAAPEIFDGRPGSNSDQYSLAVVYQEMLTSTRPFTGDTSAQLAIQHLNEKPDLRLLPKSDQPLLAKALSKDPRNRFSNCIEFVTELTNRKIRKKTVHGVQSPSASDNAADATQVLQAVNRDQTEIVSGPQSPLQEKSVEKLGPPEIDNSQDWLQPTLVVAIGGTATRAVQKLKSKMTGRHGNTSGLPSFGLLCLDTDSRTFDGIKAVNQEGTLSDNESLCLALKSPEYYRNKPAASLKWMSRRWIYNIPKSLQTEGIRPLGRLAFSDHFDKICDAFRSAIEEITLPENIAKTSDTLEATPSEKIQPRVMVVCSMNGGASGMLFDIGYLLRTILIEEGFDSDSMTAVLSHSIGPRANRAELSVANSLATLAELRHYVDCGYPGDTSLGIPEFDDQPFGNVYYHDLGEESRQSDLREQVEQVSEWIYLNSFTDGARFFDSCRKAAENEDRFDLRTFGMSIHGPTESHGTLGVANQLVSDLISKWLTHPGEPTEGTKPEKILSADEINLGTMTDVVNKVIHGNECSKSIPGLKQQAKERATQTSDVKTALSELYDQAFGMPANLRPMNYQAPILETSMEESLNAATDAYSKRLDEKFDLLLNQPSLRIDQAKKLVGAYMAAAENLSKNLTEQMATLKEESDRMLANIAAALPDTRQEFDLDGAIQAYHDKRFKQLVYRGCMIPLRVIVDKSMDFLGVLTNSVKNLNVIREQFGETSVGEPEESEEFSVVDEIMKYVADTHEERLEQFEKEFSNEFRENHGSFSDLLHDPHLLQRSLPELFRRISIRLAAETLRKVSIDKIIAAKQMAPEVFVDWLDAQLNHSLPMARYAGGNVRLLIGTPEQGNDKLMPTIVSRYFKFDSVCIPSTCGDLAFCFEGDGLSLASIAVQLATERPRVLDLSARLHCRQDIQWSRIQDLF